jgi:hypothetical protein
MKKSALLFLFFIVVKFCGAQKIDSIYFHLYTDSLKKGFYNYINIDGKTADGKWVPLSSNEVNFIVKDSALHFQNNDLFVDSAYTCETVTIKAVLKGSPKIWREVTIYIRKRGFDEPLKSNKEILEEYSKPQQKTKKKSG